MPLLHHADRSIIKVAGADSVSFLQGVLTNDIPAMTSPSLQYNLMLTPTGRFHFEALVFSYNNDEALYIDTPTAFVDEFYKRLRMYKLRANVTLEILEPSAKVVTSHNQDDHGCLLKDPRHQDLGFRGIIFDNIDILAFDTSDYNKTAMALGIPRAGYELIPETTIPLEANMEALNALNFRKGCYLGQELTTRTKHQGLVRKTLYPVTIKGSVDTSLLPLKLFQDGSVAGQLLSTIDDIGIAKLRIDCVKGDHPITDETKFVSIHVSPSLIRTS